MAPYLLYGSMSVSGRAIGPAADRGVLSPGWSIVRRAASEGSDVAPVMAMRPRSDMGSKGRGVITAIVLVCLFGGSIVVLALAFLYFRCKRRRVRPSEHDFLPPSKDEDNKDEKNGKDKDKDQGRLSPATASAPHQDQAKTSSDRGLDFDRDHYQEQRRLQSNDSSAGPSPPADYAATLPPSAEAASYYNLNISMNSLPDQANMAPTTQKMKDLYQEQVRLAREHHKHSASASASASSLDKFKKHVKQKKPSQSSDRYRQAPDEPMETVEGDWDWQHAQAASYPIYPSAAPGQMYAEPSAISPEGEGRQRVRGSAGTAGSWDRHGSTESRINSWRTELRQQAANDPQLPSAALGRTSGSDTDAFGGASVAADLYYPCSSYASRLQSPDIPEPMDVTTSGAAYACGDQRFRPSHSPTLPPGSFISPMQIHRPTNQVETAAYTDAELDRMEKSVSSSISPPQLSQAASPPAQSYEQYACYEVEDGQEQMHAYAADVDMQDQGDYPYDDPSEYSSEAGQSATNPSSGRTPDTRFTMSPSPLPMPMPMPMHMPMPPSADQQQYGGYAVTQHGVSSTSSASASASASASPEAGKALTCDECGRAFDQIHKLNHHRRYHERKHECTFEACDKKFGTKTHLDRHINDKHEKRRGYHCVVPDCQYYRGGKAFPRKDNWRRHMQNKHGLNPHVDPEPTEHAI